MLPVVAAQQVVRADREYTAIYMFELFVCAAARFRHDAAGLLLPSLTSKA